MRVRLQSRKLSTNRSCCKPSTGKPCPVRRRGKRVQWEQMVGINRAAAIRKSKWLPCNCMCKLYATGHHGAGTSSQLMLPTQQMTLPLRSKPHALWKPVDIILNRYFPLCTSVGAFKAPTAPEPNWYCALALWAARRIGSGGGQRKVSVKDGGDLRLSLPASESG